MEFGLVVRWLVAYGLLAALGRPLAARLLASLPGRGAGFALPTALVVLGTVGYWVGHVAFGPVALAAGLVVLAALAVLTGFDLPALRAGRVELRRGVRPDDASVEVATVFVAAFLFLLAIRAVDPSVHPLGGEKFLDFGLLKSLARTTRLPPEDMWFAGKPVAYYYGGHLLASLLSTLTLTPPRYAYNLALAGFYATLLSAAYGLAGAVATATDGTGSRRAAGLAAAFFVGLASNLVTAERLLVGALPPSLRQQTAALVAARTQYSVDAVLRSVASFSYWTASRVIPGTINEFPFFAWLNGDLHAHMMGTPFLLLGAALAFAYYRTAAGALRRRRVLAFLALPLLAGFQTVVDTWSVPSLFGLLFLAAAFAPADPWPVLSRRAAARIRTLDRGVASELARLAGALGVAGVAGVLGAALSLPFLLGAGAGANRGIAVLAVAERTSFAALLLVHGAFVVVFYAYLLDRLSFDRPLPVVVGLVVFSLAPVTAGLPVALLVGPLLVFGWTALRLHRPVGFETVLVVAGAGLVAIVELVYVTELAGPLRLNTVFKTYMQVWVLWGVAAGVALPAFVRWPGGDALPDGDSLPWGRVALAVLVVLATVPYAGLALSAHFAGRADPTLDATRFVERQHPGEAPAVEYVDGLEGQPHIASAPATSRYPGHAGSAPPGMYSWESSPAASLTGVPTVAGWHHEVGYRGRETYFRRVRAVDDLYTASPSRRVAVIRAYDVAYVWVGPAERDRYGQVSFDGLTGVEPVFQQGTVTIYRVDRDRLGVA
ncbi:MAG: DUF2298 domain-containing protein [Haloplanus sp.]